VATLIAPNRLRGQVSALYILMQNFIGQAGATLAVALISDGIFHDPARIGVAMAIVSASGATIGAIVFILGRKPLTRALTLSPAT
jgi:nitrate/nitrite transporter NarK